MDNFRAVITFTVFMTICAIAHGRNVTSATRVQHSRFLPVRTANLSCTADKDCGEHGSCRESSCRCSEGYITWKDSAVCSYKQKTKLEAFLFSFFLGGVGVDWFVLSRGKGAYIAAGVFKLLMSFGCCIGIPCLIAGSIRDSKSWAAMGTAASCLFSFGAPIWCLVDWIRVLADAFKDGNGAPLKPW